MRIKKRKELDHLEFMDSNRLKTKEELLDDKYKQILDFKSMRKILVSVTLIAVISTMWLFMIMIGYFKMYDELIPK